MKQPISWAILLIVLTLATINVSGQNLSIPKWAEGEWSNPWESNIEKFVVLIFSKDSIFISKGFINRKTECLNKTFAGYKILAKTKNKIYQLEFSRGNDKSLYEFKLHKSEYSADMVLDYSYKKNGEITDMFLGLMKRMR